MKNLSKSLKDKNLSTGDHTILAKNFPKFEATKSGRVIKKECSHIEILHESNLGDTNGNRRSRRLNIKRISF